MGLPTFCKNALRKKYRAAFDYKPQDRPTVCVYDLMMEVKRPPPPNVITMEHYITYQVNKVRTIMSDPASTIETMIVGVDRKPNPVKRMVEHAKRYKNKNIYASKGTYLPFKGSDPIPTPWTSFSGNYKLMQRELYPRLFNAFMNMAIPKEGQQLILHGFPGYVEQIIEYKPHAHSLGTDAHGRISVPHMWRTDNGELPITKAMEQRYPNLYNSVFVIHRIPPCQEYPNGFTFRKLWKEAENSISEMDGAMFFYDHWFQNKVMMFVCNDGDIFSYGLLYAQERVNKQNQFRLGSNHIGCIPYKASEESEDKFPPGEINVILFVVISPSGLCLFLLSFHPAGCVCFCCHFTRRTVICLLSFSPGGLCLFLLSFHPADCYLFVVVFTRRVVFVCCCAYVFIFRSGTIVRVH